MTVAATEAPDAAAPNIERRIILDGCALLNLYASRRIAEILGAMTHPCAVAEYVRDHEALWVGRHKSGAGGESDRVDVAPLVTCGLVEMLTLEGDEETAHFLRLVSSSRIDDGEAICGALAHSRGLVVATDDKAALRVFSQHAPPIATCSTASIIKYWAERDVIDANALRRVLIDVRERACFEPGPRDPLQPWWHAVRDAH